VDPGTGIKICGAAGTSPFVVPMGFATGALETEAAGGGTGIDKAMGTKKIGTLTGFNFGDATGVLVLVESKNGLEIGETTGKPAVGASGRFKSGGEIGAPVVLTVGLATGEATGNTAGGVSEEFGNCGATGEAIASLSLAVGDTGNGT